MCLCIIRYEAWPRCALTVWVNVFNVFAPCECFCVYIYLYTCVYINVVCTFMCLCVREFEQVVVFKSTVCVRVHSKLPVMRVGAVYSLHYRTIRHYIGFMMRNTFPFWCRAARSLMHFSHDVFTEPLSALIGSYAYRYLRSRGDGTTCDNKEKARVSWCSRGERNINPREQRCMNGTSFYWMFILCQRVSTTERIARDENGWTNTWKMHMFL